MVHGKDMKDAIKNEKDAQVLEIWEVFDDSVGKHVEEPKKQFFNVK